jgi:hypothetical protein
MIASPRPKILGFRFANLLRIRGLTEGRLVSRLTLTQAVSHESTLLEPAAFGREVTGNRFYFTVTVSTGSFEAEREEI